MDPADQIRARLREMQGLTGFPADQLAGAMGPDVAEVEFVDRFKSQLQAREAKQAAERQEADSQARKARSEREGMAAAVADAGPEMRRTDALSAPGLEDSAWQESDELVLPGVPAAPAPTAPAQPSNPFSVGARRPPFRAPNPAQDMADDRRRSREAGAAAAASAAPAATAARAAQQRRSEEKGLQARARAPGGLNVPPARVEADRAAAQTATARPAPARSGPDDLRERKDRARESKELAQYRIDMDRYDAERLAWQTEYDNAVEAGDLPRAETLAAAEPQPPTPPQSVTGGLDENEVKAVWDHDNDPATPRIAETAEQSLAWLRANDPKAYERLARQAQAAVGTDKESLREWASAQFGEMEPGDRRKAMQRSGSMLNANDERVNFVMPQGARGGIGDSGRGRAPRAPEGRQALDPRTGQPIIVRDPFNQNRVEPIPAPRGGLLGTPGGTRMPAPQNQAALGRSPVGLPEGGLGIESLDSFPVNPEAMTPQWREQMMGIGLMAFGLDREDFAEGPEGDDMFIASTQRLLDRHQQKVAAGFVVRPSITGGYTYEPGQAMQEQRAANARDKDTNSFLAARPAINDTDGAAELKGAVTPAERRQIKARLRQQDQEERRQALNDARSKEADQKNRNNPARAPGMFRDSLAAAGNDPQAQAAVYRNFGMPREAERILAMENQRFAVEQAGLTERAKADAEREPNGLDLMIQADNQIVGGLLDEDPTQPLNADTAIDMYDRVHSPEGKPMGPDKARDGVGRLLVQSGRPAAMAHPIVQGVLDDIYTNIGWARSDEPDNVGFVGKREFFILEARRRLNMDEKTAGAMFDRRKGTAVEQAPAEGQVAAGAAQ